MTMFVDYNFNLLPNGSIAMDSELTPEQIGVSNGDVFSVRVGHDNRIVFEKQYGIVKFIIEGKSNVNSSF